EALLRLRIQGEERSRLTDASAPVAGDAGGKLHARAGPRGEGAEEAWEHGGGQGALGEDAAPRGAPPVAPVGERRTDEDEAGRPAHLVHEPQELAAEAMADDDERTTAGRARREAEHGPRVLRPAVEIRGEAAQRSRPGLPHSAVVVRDDAEA